MPINKPSQPLIPAEIDPAVLDGKADLVNGEVPSDQLPSYVDDVLEFADVSEFPAEGEVGKIYVALDTNYTYRWSGAAYVQVGGSSLGAGNGIEIENDVVSVDEEYLNGHLEFEAPIEDLAAIRSGAAAGATAVQPADVADDLEVVAYQTQNPLSAEQLAKAEAGKLAIYKDNLVYTKFYQDGNVVSFQALEHMSENGAYTPAYNVRIRRYTLTLDRSTRMLNDAGYQQGVSVADNSANFFTVGEAAGQSGTRIVRELNIYPMQQALSGLATVATSGSYNDLSNKPTILSAQDVQDMIDASIGNVLTEEF